MNFFFADEFWHPWWLWAVEKNIHCAWYHPQNRDLDFPNRLLSNRCCSFWNQISKFFITAMTLRILTRALHLCITAGQNVLAEMFSPEINRFPAFLMIFSPIMDRFGEGAEHPTTSHNSYCLQTARGVWDNAFPVATRVMMSGLSCLFSWPHS